MLICKPSDYAYGLACDLLQAGKLCAFPTETVYGLGANALSEEAVLGIYKAKGRPSTNPLIVHVGTIDMALELVQSVPQNVIRLMETFWPGPLTLVLPAKQRVSRLARAGGETIGIRIPNRTVALELIQRAGLPLAAPSANRSGHISPTLAAHVQKSLPNIPLILDDGPCQFGIESTVLSLLPDDLPKILRHGAIPYTVLKNYLPDLLMHQPLIVDEKNPLSPGMSQKHYSPQKRSFLIDEQQLAQLTERIGVLFCGERDFVQAAFPRLFFEQLPNDPVQYASGLYRALYVLESYPIDEIWILKPPIELDWLAVWDRLLRATAF